MSTTIFKVTLSSIDQFIDQNLLPLIEAKKAHIITLEGPLGAGKTTLTKKILHALGVEGVVNSPTFGYVNSYKTSAGRVINHFDLYRLGSIEDFYQEALDELLLSREAYNFIEWPCVIHSLLNEKNILKLKLSYDPEDLMAREIVCE